MPISRWHRIGPAAVEVRPDEQFPVDDWPFLYLRDPVVPTLNIRGMAIIAVLSAVLLYAFAPAGRLRPNWQMFFMGAGFMLLETKSVVHLALLFGSTWMVNSIVVFAILVMILCSNLFVLAVKPARVWPFYALLALALLAGIVVPMSTFLNLPETLRIVASCAVVFLPIFFAGHHLRHGIPRLAPARHRLRLEHRRRRARRPQRVAVADDRLQPPAGRGAAVLRAVGPGGQKVRGARKTRPSRITDRSESPRLRGGFARATCIRACRWRCQQPSTGIRRGLRRRSRSWPRRNPGL